VTTATDRSLERIARRRAHPGWALLTRVAEHLAAVEQVVDEFRAAHPPAHRCPVCDHLRAKHRDLTPAGPFDLLAAIRVTAWNFTAMLAGDIGVAVPAEPDADR